MSKRFLALSGAAALAACLSLFAGGAARAQGQPAADEDKIYKGSEVDERAIIDRRSQRANQPSGYRCMNQDGLVRLRVVLRKTGQVTDVTVVKGSGCDSFDESAMKAVRKVAFEPAQKDGRPVSTAALFEYVYLIR